MAEKTNVKKRLEQRLSDYMQLRKKQRGKAAMALFGVQTDPSIEQMSAYNQSLGQFSKDLVSLQNKIYANESDRRKERAATLRSIMTSAQSMINNRATNATGVTKARLMARSRNIDAYLKGLDLAANDTTGVTDKKVSDKKFSDVVYSAQNKAMRKQNRDPREAGRDIAKALRDPGQREMAFQRLEQITQDYPQADLTEADVKQMRAAAEQSMPNTVSLSLDEQTAVGVIPGTLSAEQEGWMGIGRDSVVNPQEVGIAMAIEQNVIDAAGASDGGDFGLIVAEIVRGMTNGTEDDVQAALGDLIGPAGLTDQEAGSVDTAERQRELLLGQLYDPNAPSAVVQARDTLLQDPGFLQYKQSMGFMTDRAAFRGLKRQLRQKRKERKKNDRQILRQQRAGVTPQAMDAMRALQENEDRTKRLADEAVASKSATLAQPSEPQSTTAKTGAPDGRTQSNPFYTGPK